MSMVVPTMETERLVLRGWRESDLAPLSMFYAHDPSAVFVGGPRGGRPVVMWFLARLGQWSLRGYGSFAIEERSSGRWIGWCGVNHYPDMDEPEIQYALIEAARSAGFMSEALCPALHFSFVASGRDVLSTTIHPKNAASQRVARRLGASPDGTTKLDDEERVDVWHFPRVGARP